MTNVTSVQAFLKTCPGFEDEREAVIANLNLKGEHRLADEWRWLAPTEEAVKVLRAKTTAVLAPAPTLAELAGCVERQYEACRETSEAERAAEAALLASICAHAQPGLRAIADRIQIASGPAVFSVEHGVFVSDLEAPPGPEGSKGRWHGSDLFLLTDGYLMELTYSGLLNQPGSLVEPAWQAEPCGLTAVEAVEKGYRASTVLAKLTRAFEAELRGNRSRRTRDLEDRVEKLRAALAALS